MVTMGKAQLAEQSYTLSEVSRLLHVPVSRLRALQNIGEFPCASFLVPMGGRQAERWTASAISLVQEKWSPTWRR